MKDLCPIFLVAFPHISVSYLLWAKVAGLALCALFPFVVRVQWSYLVWVIKVCTTYSMLLNYLLWVQHCPLIVMGMHRPALDTLWAGQFMRRQTGNRKRRSRGFCRKHVQCILWSSCKTLTAVKKAFPNPAMVRWSARYWQPHLFPESITSSTSSLTIL